MPRKIGETVSSYIPQEEVHASAAAPAVVPRDCTPKPRDELKNQLQILRTQIEATGNPIVRRDLKAKLEDCEKKVGVAFRSLDSIMEMESRNAAGIRVPMPSLDDYERAANACVPASKALVALAKDVESHEADLKPGAGALIAKAVGIALLALGVAAVGALLWPVIAAAGVAAVGVALVMAVAGAVGVMLGGTGLLSISIATSPKPWETPKVPEGLSSHLSNLLTDLMSNSVRNAQGALPVFARSVMNSDDAVMVCSWLGIAAGAGGDSSNAMLSSVINEMKSDGQYRELLEKAIDCSRLPQPARDELHGLLSRVLRERSEASGSDDGRQIPHQGDAQLRDGTGTKNGSISEGFGIEPHVQTSEDILKSSTGTSGKPTLVNSPSSSVSSVSSPAGSVSWGSVQYFDFPQFDSNPEAHPGLYATPEAVHERALDAVLHGKLSLAETEQKYQEIQSDKSAESYLDELENLRSSLEPLLALRDFELNVLNVKELQQLGKAMADNQGYDLDGHEEILEVTKDRLFPLSLMAESEEKNQLRNELKTLVQRVDHHWDRLNNEINQIKGPQPWRHR